MAARLKGVYLSEVLSFDSFHPVAGSQLQTLAYNERAAEKEEMEAADIPPPRVGKAGPEGHSHHWESGLHQPWVKGGGQTPLVRMTAGSNSAMSPSSVKPRVSFKQTGTKPGNETFKPIL